MSNARLRVSIGTIGITAALAAGLTGCASVEHHDPVAAWIDGEAVRLPGAPGDAPSGQGAAGLDRMLGSAVVVGLGEATHGQHESFELKRTITMHLVRHHGYRLVAYEASATRAAACEAYIRGTTDDLASAVAGLGMLIWRVEENAALLRDLRAWNEGRSEPERVHFVGIDVQDIHACAARLAELTARSAPELGARAVQVAQRTEPAVQKLWAGDAADYKQAAEEADAILAAARSLADADPAGSRELLTRAHELRGGVRMFWTLGGRDLAMAEMLRAALAHAGPGAKAIVWAHNMHVSRGPMRYMGSDEPAMGGHLGQALGSGYYALGVAFGEGEFNALDRSGAGPWIFRTYAVDAPPTGSLEWPFSQVAGTPLVVDLRGAPTSGAVAEWITSGHGQRWFGGYNVRPDVRETTRDASALLQTEPRTEYDGILYIPRTTASRPLRSEAEQYKRDGR